MKINNIDICPLYGGDYIVLVNIVLLKNKLHKLNIKTEKDIKSYISKKLNLTGE